jgi:hypothetical protein
MCLRRIADEFTQMSRTVPFAVAGHRVVISRAGGEDYDFAKNLLDGEIDYECWLNGEPGGPTWYCSVDVPVDYGVSRFMSLAQQAGGILHDELSACLGLVGDLADELTLWTMALHHVAWSDARNIPFRSYCTNYRAGESESEDKIDDNAKAPRLGEIPRLYECRMYGDPFAVSAILIDMLLWSPVQDWRSLLDTRAIEVAHDAASLIKQLDRRRKDKTMIIVGIIIDIAKSRGKGQVVKLGDVISKLCEISGLSESKLNTAFKRAWDAASDEASDVLIAEQIGHKEYSVRGDDAARAPYLREWNRFRQQLEALSRPR